MSSRSRKKWDEKHAAASTERSAAPPEWLMIHLNSLPSGRALDLATGTGRSAIELARRGWTVSGIDISEIGIRLALEHAERVRIRIDWIVANLEDFRLPTEHFDVVTVFNYLDREKLPGQIVRTLRPGGILLFETFTLNQFQMPGNRMKNPDHMLRPGELLTMFPGLRIRAYRDLSLEDRAVASLAAEKV